MHRRRRLEERRRRDTTPTVHLRSRQRPSQWAPVMPPSASVQSRRQWSLSPGDEGDLFRAAGQRRRVCWLRARRQALGRHERRLRPGPTKPPLTVRSPLNRIRQSGPALRKQPYRPGTCCLRSSSPRSTSSRVDAEASMRSWQAFGDAQKTPVPARQVAGEGRPGQHERGAGFGSTHSPRPVATSGRTSSQDAEASSSTEDSAQRSEPASKGPSPRRLKWDADRHQRSAPPSTGYGPAARRTSSSCSRTTPSASISGRKSLPGTNAVGYCRELAKDIFNEMYKLLRFSGAASSGRCDPSPSRPSGSASRCSTDLAADCPIMGVRRSRTFIKQPSGQEAAVVALFHELDWARCSFRGYHTYSTRLQDDLRRVGPVPDPSRAIVARAVPPLRQRRQGMIERPRRSSSSSTRRRTCSRTSRTPPSTFAPDRPARLLGISTRSGSRIKESRCTYRPTRRGSSTAPATTWFGRAPWDRASTRPSWPCDPSSRT